MGGDLFAFIGLALAAGVVAALIGRMIDAEGLFSSPSTRLPKQLTIQSVTEDHLPTNAQTPLEFLNERLGPLGFQLADAPGLLPELKRFGYRGFLAPFSHDGESTVFLMGIASSGWHPRPELMLHIITPLKGHRSVETSTLSALRHVRPPDSVDFRVVEAESIEEIWSRHRRALTQYERSERDGIPQGGWKELVSKAYEGWIQAAIRSQRVRLSGDGNEYRIRLWRD